MKNKWIEQNSCDGKYKNSLDVRFTKACDNHCDFCIERKGICAKERNVDKMIYNTIVSGKETVLILGGEPFLYIKDLKTYVEGIRPYVKYIYITTSLPNVIDQFYDVFSDIMYLIDGLNVSLQHYDWEKNNEILHASSQHNRLELLKKICSNNIFAKKCRVSINLVKGAIDTKNELYHFLDKMEKINVKHVKINELQFTPELYVSFEEIFGESVKSLHLKSPYSHGCQSEITLKQYPNLKITLKRACPYVEPSRKFSNEDKKKQEYVQQHSCPHFTIVLYEDGELSIGWKQQAVETSKNKSQDEQKSLLNGYYANSVKAMYYNIMKEMYYDSMNCHSSSSGCHGSSPGCHDVSHESMYYHSTNCHGSSSGCHGVSHESMHYHSTNCHGSSSGCH